MNLLEMIKMATGQTRNIAEQAELLSAFGPPPKDYKPQMQIPVVNELPSFSLNQPGAGGVLAGEQGGVAGPVPGQEASGPSTIGDLLTGEINA